MTGTTLSVETPLMISRALERASDIGNVNVVDAGRFDIASAKSRGLI
jgi:hypothetical protein